MTLLRCPVGEGCDLEVEYSWHVPLTAPIRVLAVKADEWFLQVVHRVFGSLELGRHLFVSLSWAYFMVTALSVPQPPLNGVAFAAGKKPRGGIRHRGVRVEFLRVLLKFPFVACMWHAEATSLSRAVGCAQSSHTRSLQFGSLNVFFVEVADRSCSSRPAAGRSSESTGVSARALASVRVRAVACPYGLHKHVPA